jgi:hypothetical protein
MHTIRHWSYLVIWLVSSQVPLNVYNHSFDLSLDVLFRRRVATGL